MGVYGVAQDGLNRDGRHLETLSAQMKQTDALFAKLASGEHPDFLTVMAGISDMVAFYTDHDTNHSQLTAGQEKESGNNCRFCS